MHMRPILLTILVGSALMFGAAPVSAKDLKLMQQTRSDNDQWGGFDEVQYWSGSLRIADTANVRRVADMKAQTVTTIQKEKKTYFTMSFDDLRKRTAALVARLNTIPAELRTQLRLDTPIELKPTGQKEQVAGLEATKYEMGSPERGYVWIAEDFDLPEESRAWYDLVGPFGGVSAPSSPIAAALKQKKGLPVKMESHTDLGGRKSSMITEITEIKDESAPAELSKVPEGFTKVNAPAVPGTQPPAAQP